MIATVSQSGRPKRGQDVAASRWERRQPGLRIGLVGLACLVLTGCVHFQPAPLSARESVARFEQRSLADDSLRRYTETNLHRVFPTWPPPRWDLQTLTFAAFYFNPDLAVARAHCESVAAGTVTAAQRANPTVSVSPAFNTTTAVPSPWLVTATLDVPIETAGKRTHRRAQARHLFDAARFDLATAALDVRTRLRRALLELWAARAGESVLRRQLGAQERIVGLLAQEQAAGGIGPAEVSRERIGLERTRMALLEAESRRELARVELAGVVGLPLRAFEGMELSFESFDQAPPEMSAEEARRRALLGRADVLAALAEYAASEAGLRLEIARQYPDVHLSPGYEFDQGSHKWGVGLGVELPILNRNRGPIAEAEGRRKESAARFDALQARVVVELETALVAGTNARRKLAAATSLFEQTLRQERAAMEMAKAGEVSPQVEAAAQLESATAALAELDARLEAQQAAAALEAALQSPLELPLSVFAPDSNPSP